MPFRRLPDSAATRAKALDAARKKSAAKDALEGEQSDVNDLRPEADRIIRDIWDEVEFSLRQLDPPTLRRRAREWGVFYALRPGEPEEPTIETPPALTPVNPPPPQAPA